MNGLRLAFSWLTVLPISGPASVDRDTSGRAIRLVPLTGVALGTAAAGLLWLLVSAGITPLLGGLLTVAALGLASRGMHIDGLADTFDGLGCYGPPERARDVMRSGGAGPFGVAAIAVSIGVQAVSFGVLASAGAWLAVAVAVTAGRVAVVIACRRGTPAATDTGFGALVADTQPLWVAIAWTVPLLAVATWSTDRSWLGPVAVALALAGSVLLVRHCVRRFGGLSGDVLGATIEVSVAVTACVLSAS